MEEEEGGFGGGWGRGEMDVGVGEPRGGDCVRFVGFDVRHYGAQSGA